MMMPQVRDWLPQGAITEGHVQKLLDDDLSLWSSAYINGRRLAISGMQRARQLQNDAPLSVHVGQVDIDISRVGKRVLLEAGLGEKLSHRQFSAADEKLLDALVMQMMTLLAEKLAVHFDACPGDGPKSGWELVLEGKPVARIEIAGMALTSAVRKHLPSSGKKKRELQNPLTALAETPLSMTARLGQTSLPLEALRNLVAGDVIVLDRKLSDGVILNMKQSDRTVACGELTRNNGCNALTLT